MEGEQRESTQRHLGRGFSVWQNLPKFSKLFLLKLLSWEENLSGEKPNPVSPMPSSHNVSLDSGWGRSIYISQESFIERKQKKPVSKRKRIKEKKQSREYIITGKHNEREVNLLRMISGRREPSTSMLSSWSQEIRKGRSRGEEPSEPVPKLPN